MRDQKSSIGLKNHAIDRIALIRNALHCPLFQALIFLIVVILAVMNGCVIVVLVTSLKKE